MAGPLASGAIKTKTNLAKKKFAILVAEWNEDVTEALYESAVASLVRNGVKTENIVRKNVPGTFELSLGALWMGEKKDIHAVICLGCVIQGETPHFDYICQAVAQGITTAAIKTRKPVIFGVLTTLEQKASARSGRGKTRK